MSSATSISDADFLFAKIKHFEFSDELNGGGFWSTSKVGELVEMSPTHDGGAGRVGQPHSKIIQPLVGSHTFNICMWTYLIFVVLYVSTF